MSHTTLDSTSLNAYGKTNSNAECKGFITNYNSFRDSGTSSVNTNTNVMIRGNASTDRSSLFCDYCKRSGYTKDICYKLHVYPSNLRFQKGKDTSSAHVCASDMNGHQSKEGPKFKKQMPLNLFKD